MLKDIVNNAKCEEELQSYLKENNDILVATFGTPEWAYNITIPKFKFGSDFISDFVIIHGQSNSYWIELIELEPADANIFTKEGVYSYRLNGAIKQLDEWSDWIKDNLNYFKSSLQKASKEIYPEFYESFNNNRRFIINKHIVIGRRESLTEADNKRRSCELEKSYLDIATYDRLIEIEERLVQMKSSGKSFERFGYED